MLLSTAAVMIILYVLEAQVDILFAAPSPNKTIKLFLLLGALVTLFFLHFGRGF